MSEPNSTPSANASPEVRARAKATESRMTPALREAIGKEATGKGGKELEAIAAKHGVSASSVYLWRQQIGGGVKAAPPKPGPGRGQVRAGTVGLPFDEKSRVALIKRANSCPTDHAAFFALKLGGHDKSVISKWRKLYNMPRQSPATMRGMGKGSRIKPEGNGRHKRKYTDAFKAEIVERSRHMRSLDLATETGIDQSVIYRWRLAAGISGSRGGRRKLEAPPSDSTALLSPDDQALLQGHGEVKARDRNLLERVRNLEKENLVLKANLAYAIERGYLKLFDLDQMFTKKG